MAQISMALPRNSGMSDRAGCADMVRAEDARPYRSEQLVRRTDEVIE